MANLSNRKVLFFLAGQVATAPELAAIDAIVGQVQIRSGLVPALYGVALEPCDAVAGTVPVAYNAKPLASTAGVAVADGASVPVLTNAGNALAPAVAAVVRASPFGVKLPATVDTVANGVAMVVPVTGTYVTTITATVVNNAITGFVLS